jgi:hypothetical protein
MATTLLEDPGSDPSRRRGTTVLTPGSGTRLATPVSESASSGDRSTDPVVGWLVVIDGPGRGSAVELGYGMNQVGRGGANRVPLDFGDDQISAEDHFRVAYDPESREFHLIPAKGTNLLYVAGKALLTPTALPPMTDIRVGATTLRFVALCTPEWDWSVQSSATG